MSVPYEIAPKSVSVGGGQTTTESVSFPPRSVITKIVVSQTTGNREGFAVELFNHADALEGTETSSSATDSADKVPLDCYRVCSKKLVPAGADSLLYFSDEAPGGHGLTFFSQDKASDDRQGQQRRTLYLRITPNGSGSKKFVYCIGGETMIAGA